ncbi:IclR family transcriptional regulator domain-containing protein [Pontitalea aquivivens]|uniref:IclR family transcriptional regulator domain-containing protein n=1 Tax=Pontitalea aquivivens TaxID=3388663 RepID=UPI0039705864
MHAVNRKELNAELEIVRKCGYSVTRSERIAGLTAIAAPIHDYTRGFWYVSP